MNIENITDIVILIALSVFFITGCLKGLLRTLLGPLALVAAICLSYYYYLETKNVLIASGILFLGPLIIRLISGLLLRLWNISFDDNKKISPLSRISGGLFSLVFRGMFFFAVIFALILLPKNIPGLSFVQEDILNSKTYGILDHFLGEHIGSIKHNVKKLAGALRNPEQLKEMAESKEYQDLMENESFKDLVTDPQTQELIEDKNYAALLQDKNFQQILSDPEALNKILAFQQKIITKRLTNQSENISASHSETSSPKVIEIPSEETKN